MKSTKTIFKIVSQNIINSDFISIVFDILEII